MSKSYHSTHKELKGKTKEEINEMINDPDSTLHKLAEKSNVKKDVIKQRKINKNKQKNNHYIALVLLNKQE